MTVTETTTPITATEADKALKAKHAAMWASGDYPAVADEIVGSLGARLVETVDVQQGQQVLDVASGTGTSALPAARRGAQVTATDLTPELLAIGEQQAAAEGLQLRWRVGDAENLPCNDREYDAVLSCIGVMFAPHHQTGRRRAGPGLPTRRDDRRAQLDPGRLHRSDVRDPEAVRPAAPTRSVSGAAVGSCRSRPHPVRRPGHRPGGTPAEPAGGSVRHRVRSSGTSSRSTTVRRSRSTGSSPTTRRRSPPSTPTWRHWVIDTWSTASSSGSTCWSPPSGSDQPNRLEPIIRFTSMINATRFGFTRGCR